MSSRGPVHWTKVSTVLLQQQVALEAVEEDERQQAGCVYSAAGSFQNLHQNYVIYNISILQQYNKKNFWFEFYAMALKAMFKKIIRNFRQKLTKMAQISKKRPKSCKIAQKLPKIYQMI